MGLGEIKERNNEPRAKIDGLTKKITKKRKEKKR